MAKKIEPTKEQKTCPYCDAAIAEAAFPYCEACEAKVESKSACPGCGADSKKKPAKGK
jgi:hypothetical protein